MRMLIPDGMRKSFLLAFVHRGAFLLVDFFCPLVPVGVGFGASEEHGFSSQLVGVLEEEELGISDPRRDLPAPYHL